MLPEVDDFEMRSAARRAGLWVQRKSLGGATFSRAPLSYRPSPRRPSLSLDEPPAKFEVGFSFSTLQLTPESLETYLSLSPTATMVRKLKYHESRLLKKVDFITYKQDDNHRSQDVSRRYMIQKPEDYFKYNRLAGVSDEACVCSEKFLAEFTSTDPYTQSIRQLAHRLSLMPPDNPVRRKHEQLLLDKLYDMGILSSASKLSAAEHISVSAFARRRLPVVLTRLRMAETLKSAIQHIEQGQIRVGTEVVTDPAYLVVRISLWPRYEA